MHIDKVCRYVLAYHPQKHGHQTYESIVKPCKLVIHPCLSEASPVVPQRRSATWPSKGAEPYVSHSSTPRPLAPRATRKRAARRKRLFWVTTTLLALKRRCEKLNTEGLGKKLVGRFGLLLESLKSVCPNANRKRQTDHSSLASHNPNPGFPDYSMQMKALSPEEELDVGYLWEMQHKRTNTTLGYNIQPHTACQWNRRFETHRTRNPIKTTKATSNRCFWSVCISTFYNWSDWNFWEMDVLEYKVGPKTTPHSTHL